jgi:hypothetical protein
MPLLPRRLRASLALSTCLALAAGCGGGLYIGIGDGDSGDRPPSVSLTANVSGAQPGDTVRLSAAASDDYAVDEVQFFRLQFDGSSIALGSMRQPPYVLNATMPDTAAAQVQFYARAIDDVGQRSSSSPVTVQVLR